MMLLWARAYRVILGAISARVNSKMPANCRYGSGRQSRRECLEALESRTLLDGMSFDSGRTFDVGAGPYALCMGDFNGDGKIDIASANGNTTSISVLMGNGDGTFRTRTDYGVSTHPSSLVVSDFNGDGKSDIAVAVFDSNVVSIFLGNGNGTFQTKRDVATVGPGAICAGDLNGDGKSDLAVTGGDDTVRILLGNGDGSFRAASANNVGSGPTGLAVGDFNGDGISDLVSANYVMGSNVSILLGNGDGTYRAANNYAALYPLSVATGDFNNDGRCDIAVANAGGSTVGIMRGNGDGTFEATGNFGVDSYVQSVAVGYFNNDEYSDIVTVSYISNTVNILPGNGDGTFGSKIAYGVGSIPRAVMVGDFNGDGRPDIAAANAISNNVSILLNTGDFEVQAAFSNLGASSAISYGTSQITLSGTLKGNGTPIPDGETVTVTINGIAHTTTTAGGKGHFSLDYPTGSIPASITPYAITYSYAGDANFIGTSDGSTTLKVNRVTPSFTNLSAPAGIAYGTSEITVNGTLAAGATPVPDGEIVTITINGAAQTTTTTGGNGGFSLQYPTATMPVSATPYPITFDYGGDGNFNIITDNTSRTLSVMQTTISSVSIPENQPAGTVVGALSVSGPNGGAPFTYSLVSGAGSADNGSFKIGGNQLLTNASFDYEAKNSYSIRVRTTDQGGMSFEKAFTINVTDVDEIAPTVTAVYVRGSSWAAGYLSFLAANLTGSSATYGYAIPTGSGAAQLQTLPWRNLNRISIAFSEDVSIAQAQLAIVGSVGSYSVSGFSYSAADHVATWSLSAVIGPDKLYVALPGSGSTPVKDIAGNVLDGEWNNPTSYSDAGPTNSFPSGNGTAGGDFAFRFDVLPGDSTGGSLGKVNVADIAQTKSRSGPPVSVSSYRSDFDGNNLVNVADIAYVKSRSGINSLPVNPPVLPVFGLAFSQMSLLLKSRSLTLW